MRKARRNIQPRIERAELSVQRHKRPERHKPPAPDDPQAVDCSHHDDFGWEIFKLRGMYAFHPQDKRITALDRLTLGFVFWRIHARRKT